MDNKAFTGLEAAIVLIAFVVVAATFSYTILGAGFFTTQKSQEVVHNSIEKASSSPVLDGDVIVRSGKNDGGIDKVYFYITNSAGGSPIDIEKSIITYTDKDEFKTYEYYGDELEGKVYYEPYMNFSTYNYGATDAGITLRKVYYLDEDGNTTDKKAPNVDIHWAIVPITGNYDYILESGETFKIIFSNSLDTCPDLTIDKNSDLGTNFAGTDEQFKIEFKPPSGAPLVITRTTPSSLTSGNYYTVY